jgi:hypothetical protein
LLCCIQSLLFICIYVHIIYNIHYKLYFLLSLEYVRLNKWRETIKCCCQTYSCGRCLKINVAMYVSKVQEYFQLWKNTIKFVIKSEYSEFITYVFLYVSAIFVNKVNITYLWRKKLWMSGVKYVNTHFWIVILWQIWITVHDFGCLIGQISYTRTTSFVIRKIIFFPKNPFVLH